MTDKRAIKLLNKACWGSYGWKTTLDLTQEETDQLESAGFARPPRKLTHAQCVAWALESLSSVTSEQVTAAFVSSLTSRQLHYRSALGSFAHLHLMRKHSLSRPRGTTSKICVFCGADAKTTLSLQDFIILNFERYKWGGVRHDHVYFVALDLEMFAKLPEISPTAEDWKALNAILAAAAAPETGRTVTTMKKAICKIIKSNDSEADTLCHILAYAGILAVEDYPGFDGQYVPWNRRHEIQLNNDQSYSLTCWKGPGFRSDAVRYWFPELAGG